MGILNWYADKVFNVYAKEITDIVDSSFRDAKLYNPKANKNELLAHTMRIMVKFKDSGFEAEVIDRFCFTIEGVTYFIAFIFRDAMKKQDVKCWLQLISIMDEMLYNKGYPRQDVYERMELFDALGIGADYAELFHRN